MKIFSFVLPISVELLSRKIKKCEKATFKIFLTFVCHKMPNYFFKFKSYYKIRSTSLFLCYSSASVMKVYKNELKFVPTGLMDDIIKYISSIGKCNGLQNF